MFFLPYHHLHNPHHSGSPEFEDGFWIRLESWRCAELGGVRLDPVGSFEKIIQLTDLIKKIPLMSIVI